MKIAENKVVAITYNLSINKELVEIVDAKQPMLFLYGNSGLPEKFEEKLEGFTAGDTFEFTLNPEEAFGKREEDDVLNLPIQDFYSEDGMLDKSMIQVGKFIPLTDDQGHHHRAKVLEINELEKYIKFDFNHPLADKVLEFVGKVETVREATKEEIEHGHAHGHGGHVH